jgi:FdrA protein
VVQDAADACATPVVLGLLGPGERDLTAIAAATLEQLGAEVPTWPTWGAPDTNGAAGDTDREGRLVGLFAGGTLCAEALLVAEAGLGEVHSNLSKDPALAMGAEVTAPGHVLVDLGEDDHTRGRPHPMIDQQLRLERIAAEVADPTTTVLLLDAVLGHGAHPDPAGELAPAIADARRAAADAGRHLDVIVSLCGTAGDPQGRDGQAQALADAGAHVFASNADAARAAVGLVRTDREDRS